MEFIHGTTLVHLKMRCWSGEKKASRDSDIRLGTDGNMPPQKLLDLGRKKIFPPKALDPLLSKRKSAERACLAEGTRFMGGFAVRDEAIDDVVAKLETVKAGFESALQQFLNDFDRNKEDWIAENEEYAHIMRDQVPDRETVASAFKFEFKLYKMQPLEGFEPDEAEIADQILHEVGLSCREMSDRLLERKRAIGGKTLCKQLDPLVTKLDTLSFGNGRILRVLGEFRALCSSIPAERIDQDHPVFGRVLTFLTMCSDDKKLERIVSGEFSVTKLIAGLQSGNAQPQVSPSSTYPTTASAMGAYF
ncbi:DUF3150 domain-containing protein [Marinobacter salinexigens]|jgi:hypothetical protein|uniref:DUF3150 domain-containing protein n=1 Tax=Marinobacter salinexigens TaxID=2919747 RepID=A0A5B0VFL3_9GAMM|nr:DUF3150 domain-containing protein [Marinobacter salinexigens]KAA1173234.1 DUF3150 domain-containing protein [Marinobacter salinexigens]